MVEKKQLPSNKIFILPNSIDINKYKPNNRIKKFDLITLGRLSKEKELFFLLDIVKKLKPDFSNIKVGIAGKGPLFKELQQSIKNLSLDQNVTLLGYVDDAVEFLNINMLNFLLK